MRAPVPSSVRHCTESPWNRLRVDDPKKVSRRVQLIEAGYVALYASALVKNQPLPLPDARTGEPFRTKQTLAYQCAKMIVEGECPLFSADEEGSIIPKQPEIPPDQGLHLVK